MAEKKHLRDLIFKYKDDPIFKNSNNLKRFHYDFIQKKKDEERKLRQ